MVVVIKSQFTTSHSILARLLRSKFEYIYSKIEAINDADTGFLQEQQASFSKSSSLGSDLQPSHERNNGKQQAAKSCVEGGHTSCVPGCFSNCKRDKHLAFYALPNGKSKEKQTLQKILIHILCRKDFKLTLGHRVYSEHFVGGKKTYLNQFPTITPKKK